MTREFIRKQDLHIAAVIGIAVTISLNVWFESVSHSVMLGDYLWLARLQEPGIRAGEATVRFLHPLIGLRWALILAVLSAYGVLLLMWSICVFTLINLLRLIASTRRVVGV